MAEDDQCFCSLTEQSLNAKLVRWRVIYERLGSVHCYREGQFEEVAALIDGNAAKIAIVLDGSGTVVGTISDGDLRRGMLDGVPFEAPAQGFEHVVSLLRAPMKRRRSSP